jgi:hypothetical protein
MHNINIDIYKHPCTHNTQTLTHTHTYTPGSIVAGVIGNKKLRFDMWGSDPIIANYLGGWCV